MNVNMYLFFFEVIIEWISFSLNRQDETLMTLRKKIAQSDGIILSA